MDDATHKAAAQTRAPVAVETFRGRVHMEWDPAAAVTPLGQVPPLYGKGIFA